MYAWVVKHAVNQRGRRQILSSVLALTRTGYSRTLKGPPMSNTVVDILGKLCSASQKQFVNPYTAFQWPDRLDDALWCMPPELISIEGTEEFAALGDSQRRKLSLLEICNFFSLTLQGEKTLIEKVARYLYRPSYQEATAYLQHFLDEETKHIVYFGEFCNRYLGKVYPDRHIAGGKIEYAPGEEDFSIFASILVFEEIGNYYNIQMARDARLNPIVREINALHRREEARHLAFGRALVADLFARHSPRWSESTLARVRDYLAGFILSTWKEFFNPDAYREAGLENTFALYEKALESPASRARFANAISECSEFLIDGGILVTPPTYDV
jgi:hypothetical protein